MRIERESNAVSVFFDYDISADYELFDDFILFCKTLGLYTSESDELYDSELAFGKSVFVKTQWHDASVSQNSITALNDFITSMEKASRTSETRPIVRIALRDDDAFNSTLTKIYEISGGKFSIIPIGKQRVCDILAPTVMFLYEIEFKSEKTLLAYKLAA